MSKLARCTICTWRGTFEEAAALPRVTPSQIPPPLEDLQTAYAERESANIAVGASERPPCPKCGHHLVGVHRPSFAPSAT
jgi:hypothetical protein